MKAKTSPKEALRAGLEEALASNDPAYAWEMLEDLAATFPAEEAYRIAWLALETWADR